MRKVLAVLLSTWVIINLCAFKVSTKSTQTFSDVPISHWAYSYIEQAVEKGYANGVGEGQYNPDSLVSNAQFVAMLIKGFMRDDLLQNSSKQSEWNQWWGPYMQTALDQNLLTGMTIGKRYDKGGAKALAEIAEAPITRYDMAEAISEITSYLHIDAPTSEAITRARASIHDYKSIPNEYRFGVDIAYAYGCLTGIDSKGTFAGNAGMTRAQAAVVLIRLDELNKAGTISPEPPYKRAIDYIGLTVNDVANLWGADFQYSDYWLFGAAKAIYYTDFPVKLYFLDLNWEGKAGGEEKICMVDCHPNRKETDAITEIAPNIPLQINAAQLAQSGYDLSDASTLGADEFGAATGISIKYTSQIEIYFFWNDSVDIRTKPADYVLIWDRSP